MEIKILSSFTWTVCLLQTLLALQCHAALVRFFSEDPLYGIPGKTLILQARIEAIPGLPEPTVAWELNPVDKKNWKVKVAEYPGKSSNERMIVENKGATVRITKFHKEDCGIYTVSVTDPTGVMTSSLTVKEYVAVHHVSVTVNISHSSLHCKEAWGTEPVFRWLHDNKVVKESLGSVSKDGTELYLTSTLCGHFTCVVSNKLGENSDTYSAELCESKGKAGTTAVICLFFLICAGTLAVLLWRYQTLIMIQSKGLNERHRRRRHSRGERLRENQLYEDDL
ncbi:uncharacterized protein LOC114788633 isoform X2 [Denticeps clupeoides]|nr:uncharacterized protein LOC114788633 isoform X2 [Denticeps clupeoides]